MFHPLENIKVAVMLRYTINLLQVHERTDVKMCGQNNPCMIHKKQGPHPSTHTLIDAFGALAGVSS